MYGNELFRKYMHGDTIEILPIDYAIVFVWNMGERERLNNENLDSDKFPYVSREAPRQSVNVTYAIYSIYTFYTLACMLALLTARLLACVSVQNLTGSRLTFA